jgi:hypothetical protein
MIYTTYFAKLKTLPKYITPVAICAKPIQGYQGASYRQLAPHYNFYSKYKTDKNETYFTTCYHDQVLRHLNPTRVVADLYSLAAKSYCDGDIALVCYEKSSDFCHRHLIAEWLRENGFECEEFDYTKDIKETKLDAKY